MMTNVTSLLKTVKAVEDEATKGTRGLEATIEHIKQELAVFSFGDPPLKTSTPEDFIRMTKGITLATTKAVAAGNSCRQEDVIATANLSRRAIADMLHLCKQAAYHPEVSKEVQSRALRYGNECAVGYLGLLEHVLVVGACPAIAVDDGQWSQCLISAVKAAQKAPFNARDEQAVVVKSKMVGPIAQIIAAQEEMLRKERELDEARKKLATIRQQQYKFLPSRAQGGRAGAVRKYTNTYTHTQTYTYTYIQQRPMRCSGPTPGLVLAKMGKINGITLQEDQYWAEIIKKK